MQVYLNVRFLSENSQEAAYHKLYYHATITTMDGEKELFYKFLQ